MKEKTGVSRSCDVTLGHMTYLYLGYNGRMAGPISTGFALLPSPRLALSFSHTFYLRMRYTVPQSYLLYKYDRLPIYPTLNT